MINAKTIEEILSLYKKHGWNLRRVLLTDEARVNLNDALQNLFGGAEIVSSRLDALWFSRPSKNQGEAWELRRLTGSPFALVEVFEAGVETEIREDALRATEKRMREVSV
jgi:hypothetical protein